MLLRLIGDLLGRNKRKEPAPSPVTATRPGTASSEPLSGQAGDQWVKQGRALEKKRQLEAALECYLTGARAEPPSVQAQVCAANVLIDLWRMEEAVQAYAKAARMAPHATEIFSGLLFFSHFSAKPDRAALFDMHRRFGEVMAHQVAPIRRPAAHDLDRDRRLRVGYVSPNLSRHSVGYFMEPVIARHDRSAFEVYCYYTHPHSDDTTEHLARLADQWRPAHAADDEALARMIVEDRIDVLVDLSGHTALNRLRVFARKPAPVQVTWLGYPDTTGLATIDYRITDAIADPAPRADAVHTERLLRLDDVFLCYQPPEDSPAVQAREPSEIVFGSFNALSKVNARVIGAWARILREVPGSRLLIKANLLQYEETARRVMASLARHGIARGQVEFHAWTTERSRHLDLYNRVDIALDTFPYNGTTTTCEALWMGVPVVTLAGDAHMSRVGATLLGSTGLQDLVAADTEAYIATAVALARNSARRGLLRSELRERVARSPLLDHAGFVSKLEREYRRAWKSWCAAQSA